MHTACLALATADILTLKKSSFHVSFVILGYPCLQSMSSRGISCYRILVGCHVAASPPGLQARMSRAILLMRVSADEESRWRVKSMVSDKLLLDLSIKAFAGSMKKIGFSVCDCAVTNKRMSAAEV